MPVFLTGTVGDFVSLVFVGDSITAGADSLNPGDGPAFPAYVSPHVSSLSVNKVFAAGGNMTDDLALIAPTVDALVVPGRHNILNVLIGINNMQRLGQDAAEVKAAIKAYCLAERAAGWTIVLDTLLPLAGNDTADAENIERKAVNVLIRADGSFYDALADIGDTSTVMGADTAPNDPTLYTVVVGQPKIHPTVAGHQLLAPIVLAAIRTVLP